MKKIFVLSLLFLSTQSFAWVIVNDGANMCGIHAYDKMYATYELNSYTCSAGQFLPADAIACETCPTDYSCSGGNFYFDAKNNQGLNNQTIFTHDLTNTCATNAPHRFIANYQINSYNCSAGYYLPADGTECTLCPANNLCVGGTYTYNATTDQGIVACVAPTPYAPIGSDSVCYPHILHVGADNVYLRSTKQTTPSLNIQIGNDVFYANMTTVPTYMNKNSTHYLHILYEGDDYYVCDDTTYNQ